MCETLDLEPKWWVEPNFMKVGHLYTVPTLPPLMIYNIENTRLSPDQIYCIKRGSGSRRMIQSRLAESYHASHELFGGAGSVWMASLLRHYYPGVTHFGALGPEETYSTKQTKPSKGNEQSKGKEQMHD